MRMARVPLKTDVTSAEAAVAVEEARLQCPEVQAVSARFLDHGERRRHLHDGTVAFHTLPPQVERRHAIARLDHGRPLGKKRPPEAAPCAPGPTSLAAECADPPITTPSEA